MHDFEANLKDRVVLVTGGGGAIGSNLVTRLSGIGVKLVLVLDNLSASYPWNIPDLPNVLFVKGDVRSEEDLKRVFAERPSIVFHLAAFFANQNSIDYPERDLDVNGLGTLRVLEYSAMHDVERLVYASSGCSIYGSEAPLPLREEFSSMHLTTPYQITKMLGELYANFFYHHHGLPVVKTRFFNSYGPGEVPGQYRNVIPNFIYFAKLGMTLPFTGNPDATRDFCYVDDLVDGVLRASFYEGAIGQEMNLASGVETRILDMACTVNELVGNEGGITEAPRRKWDTKNRLLASIDRANDLIGYKPSVPFDEVLRRTVGWFEDNWENVRADAEFPPGMSSAVRGFSMKR